MIGFEVWIKRQSNKTLFIACEDVKCSDQLYGFGLQIKSLKCTLSFDYENRIFIGDFKHHRFIQGPFRGQYDWRKPVVFRLYS